MVSSHMRNQVIEKMLFNDFSIILSLFAEFPSHFLELNCDY